MLGINVWPVGDHLFSARGKGSARPTQRQALKKTKNVKKLLIKYYWILLLLTRDTFFPAIIFLK
jgi:hypothetical protein